MDVARGIAVNARPSPHAGCRTVLHLAGTVVGTATKKRVPDSRASRDREWSVPDIANAKRSEV